MELTHEQKLELARLRIVQAKETIEDVAFLIENDRLIIAINRIYYGMFYSLLALALLNNFKTSKHAQLLGWFNKEFVYSNKIDEKFGKIINEAFGARNDGDYAVGTSFTEAEVNRYFENMKLFISEIEKYIDNYLKDADKS